MATLYELTGQYQYLLYLMEDPEVDPQIIEDSLEAISGDIEAKADGYAKVDLELASESAALKVEIDRLSARKDAIDNNRKRLKENLKNAMILMHTPKIKTDLFTFNIQKNPPKVVIDRMADIPLQFLIHQDPKVDTAAVKKSLQNPEEAPIWEGIAHLEQGESLRIR